MESVINRAPQPPAWDRDSIGYVNVVDAIWEDNEWLDDATGEVYDDGEEPIEGCTQECVGRKKVALDGLVPSSYALWKNPGSFRTYYMRPAATTTYYY